MPALLALGALLMMTLAHGLVTSVRARRHDLAILGALGLSRGQTRRAIVWEAVTLCRCALLVGIPIGIAGASLAWLVFTRSLGITPGSAVPGAALVVLVGAVVVLAALIGAACSIEATRARRAAGGSCPPSSSGDGEHAVEGDPGPLGRALVDRDPVDDRAVDEVLQHPAQVRGVDAEHRRAGAHQRVERDDGLVGRLLVQAVDQVDLRADADDRPRRGVPATALMMKSVEPTWSASSQTSWLALGVDDDDAPRGARRGRPRRAPAGTAGGPSSGPSTAGRWRSLQVGLGEAAPCRAGGSRRACRRACSPSPSRCCGRGAGPGRTAPSRRRRRLRPELGTPTRARRGRSSTCRPRRRAARRRPSARPRSSCT